MASPEKRPGKRPGARYGQFCPVAKAAEVVAERWTPLVLRELLCGSRRFNEIRRGVPRMSPSLLSKRLDELERAGVVTAEPREEGRGHEYRLTEAGEELRPVIEQLGVWGQRWARSELDPEDLDPDLLMRDVRRGVRTGDLPRERLVALFRFPGQPGTRSRYWLVLRRGAPAELCLKDPGHEVDLWITTELPVLTAVWLGDVDFEAAVAEGRIDLQGPASLRRGVSRWLGASLFAGVERPPAHSS